MSYKCPPARRECFVAWEDRSYGRMNAYREQDANYPMPKFVEVIPSDVIVPRETWEKVERALELGLEAFAVCDRKGWLEMNPRKDLREALALIQAWRTK